MPRQWMPPWSVMVSAVRWDWRSICKESEGKAMTYNEHKVAMGRAMTELMAAVKDAERALRRREKAIDDYEQALDKLLAEVPA